MKFLFKVFVFIGVFLYSEAYSWGITGHRTVAEIAENHLSKKSKRHLKKIIGSEKLAYLANWPDFIKSDSLHTYKETEIWHYVNVDKNLNEKNFTKELKNLVTPNLYSATISQIIILKNKKSSLAEKQTSLKFLIHFIADLHQPLHVGRAEDQGGNLIPLTFNKEATNLHSLWDTKLVDFQKYSYTEFASILDKKTKTEMDNAKLGNLENWFFESYVKAAKIYSQSTPNAIYGYDYNYKFSGLLEQQLYLGGVRLAKILNEIL